MKGSSRATTYVSQLKTAGRLLAGFNKLKTLGRKINIGRSFSRCAKKALVRQGEVQLWVSAPSQIAAPRTIER